MSAPTIPHGRHDAPGSACGSSSSAARAPQQAYQTLAQFSRAAPRTPAALEEARAALATLSAQARSKPLFPDRWDLGKVAAAVAQAAVADLPAPLEGGSALAPRVRAAWGLVAAGFAACPLTACVDLSAAMEELPPIHAQTGGITSTCLDDAHSASLVQQLREASPAEAVSATTVVLSLLHACHMLAVSSALLGESNTPWQCVEAAASPHGALLAALFAPPPLHAMSSATQNSLSTTGGGGGGDKRATRADLLKPVQERFCGQFLAVVLDTAVQLPSQLESALRYLCPQPLSCTTAEAAVTFCLQSGWHHATCVAAWARLCATVFERTGAALSRHQRALAQAWDAACVADQLRGLLVGAPRHLTEAYLEPLGGLRASPVATASTLQSLVETAARLPSLDVEAVVQPLRALRRAEAHVPACRSGTQVSVLTEDVYRAVVRPTAVLVLREACMEAAAELLDWSSPLGLDEGWRRRLSSSPSLPRRSVLQQSAPPLDSTDDACAAGSSTPPVSPLFSASVETLVGRCSGAEASDALWASTDAVELRCLCHALLHQVGPWAAAVLTDPFAYNVPFVSLGKLVHLLLNVGDVPLARTYLSALCVCVAQRRSKMGLAVYLQVLSRFATTVSASTLYAHRPTLNAAHAAWATIAEVLSGLWPLPPRSPYSSSPSCGSHFHGVACYPYTRGGETFEARRAAFAQLRAAVVPPTSRAPGAVLPSRGGAEPATVVALQLCGGDLVVERHRLSDPLCAMCSSMATVPLPSTTHMRLPVADRVRDALTRVTAAMRDNRVQLAQGCAASHEDRRVWWRRRFQIEAAVREVVEALDAALGPARALLSGELPQPLRLVVWELSRALATAVRAELGSDIVAAAEDWEARLYTVMCALPLLSPPLVNRAASCEQSGVGPEDLAVAAPPYPLPLSPCCTHASCSVTESASALDGDATQTLRVGCDACHVTRERAVDALVRFVQADLVKNGSDADDAEMPGARRAARVHELCENAVHRLLHHLVSWQRGTHIVTGVGVPTCGGDSDSGQSGRGRRQHVDVFRLPREHVHLVLHGSLHLLPWECTEVLRWFSASRVPSLKYVEQQIGEAGTDAAGTALPNADRMPRLDRVHFALNEPTAAAGETTQHTAPRGGSHSNSNSTTSKDRFAALLARHPRWTVTEDDYDVSGHSSTAQSSANTSEHDSSAASDQTTAAAGRGQDSRLWQQLSDEAVTGYVYVGHKTGEHLIARAQLLDRFPTPSTRQQPRSPGAPSLVCLMGCSSAFMAGGEGYEGYGMPWAYLHAGTASFIGCLWDITDRDTDRLTRRLLTILSDGGRGRTSTAASSAVEAREEEEAAPIRLCSAGEALAQARLVCKLPFLSGAAVVLYGVNTVMRELSETVVD